MKKEEYEYLMNHLLNVHRKQKKELLDNHIEEINQLKRSFIMSKKSKERQNLS